MSFSPLILASPDTKGNAQPIAVVRPLRLEQDEPNSNHNGVHQINSNDHEQTSSDVEVTIISSESSPPVTYIGNPSEELGDCSEKAESPSSEVSCVDSQTSVIVHPEDHEYVMVPGEVIRRRGSILKNPNAPVSDFDNSYILLERVIFWFPRVWKRIESRVRCECH